MDDKVKEALKKIIIRIGISGHYDLLVQNKVVNEPKLTSEEAELLKNDKECLLLINGIRQHRWENWKRTLKETLGEEPSEDAGFVNGSPLESSEDFIDMIYKTDHYKIIKRKKTK